MTRKEILKKNKIIAEFMGWKFGKYKNLPDKAHMMLLGGEEIGLSLSQMNYHCSWDWIMPVVKKVESEIGSVIITPKICRVEMKFMPKKRYAKENSIDFTDVPPIAESNTGTFLENVYNCMVDAIKIHQKL